MDDKLNPLEEYKALRQEMMVYQQEMHRTWLWAIIPAGAVYTWLGLHMKELTAVQVPNVGAVWFIPAAFVLLCFIRYLGFSHRIERLALYQCKLEENGYERKESCGDRLCGLARWNRGLGEAAHTGALFDPNASLCVAFVVWLGLLVGCTWLSCALSQTPSTLWLVVASLVSVGLSGSYVWLSCRLWRRECKDAHSATANVPAEPAPSAHSPQPASPDSNSVAPLPPARTPASSQPTNKP
jgi:hypothetical protein